MGRFVHCNVQYFLMNQCNDFAPCGRSIGQYKFCHVIYRIFNVFFSTEETRPLVSIFTYIDAMLLNLEAPVPQQTKRKFVNLSVLKNFIKFQIFQKISKF